MSVRASQNDDDDDDDDDDNGDFDIFLRPYKTPKWLYG